MHSAVVARRVGAGRDRISLLATCATIALACVSQDPVRGSSHPNTAAAGGERAANGRCGPHSIDDLWAPPGVCVTRVVGSLDRPRHLAFAPDGELYASTRRGLVVMWDADHDGDVGHGERVTIGAGDLANQGLAFSPDQRFVYYASDTVVRRLPYRPHLRASDGAGEVVVRDVPISMTHPYKSLTFDREGRLYLAVGSASNLEAGPGALILRYTVGAEIPAGGLAYDSGERFATGIRNAEGLAWDPEGRLWAVSSGRDYLRVSGEPAEFFLDHPGDEIFRMRAEPGAFYGYPHCFRLGPVPWGARRDATSAWADPEAAAGHDDAWCQNPANVQPVSGVLPPHVSPLGAVVYTGSLLPPEYRGNLIIASHGSWNRPTRQNGRLLYRAVIDGDRVVRVEPLLGKRNARGDLGEGEWAFRPTGITQGPDGALYVSSDDTGEIYRVGYVRE